jgi:ABC-2 type transport system ATP-binding protein
VEPPERLKDTLEWNPSILSRNEILQLHLLRNFISIRSYEIRIKGERLSMIHLENISKSFGSITAVDQLSLLIETGEVFGLLGPNGAGKTTTVNIAVGLYAPDRGEVNILGQGSPLNPAVRAHIGTAPQSIALYDDLTAEENLLFFGKMYKLSRVKLRDRVAESLEFVGLTDRRKTRIKTFSGGMKRRLNLAVALLHEPPVIVLDEPTAGVDPQSRNALFDNIKLLHKKNRTIVYTTHYMEEAERLCTRIGIMDRGKLLALDTVENLIKSHGGKSILTAQRSDREFRIETHDPMAELLKLQESGNLQRFKVDSPDLESVFLNLTGRKLRD